MSNVRGKGAVSFLSYSHLSIFAQLPEQKYFHIQKFSAAGHELWANGKRFTTKALML